MCVVRRIDMIVTFCDKIDGCESVTSFFRTPTHLSIYCYLKYFHSLIFRPGNGSFEKQYLSFTNIIKIDVVAKFCALTE